MPGRGAGGGDRVKRGELGRTLLTARWEKLRPDLDYAKMSGPANPKKLPTNATAFDYDLLLAFAERTIAAEYLGEDDTPDLLSISFSSNDAVDHAWGFDSPEVVDITLQSDLVWARLLTAFDRHVGRGRYVLVMSADHGVCPLPEASRRQRRQAAARAQTLSAVGEEAFLTERYGVGAGKWAETLGVPWVYLNAKSITAAGEKLTEVEATLAEWSDQRERVRGVLTRTELTAKDAIGQMVSRSFCPAQCGVLCVLLEPNDLPSAPLGRGTTLGSPWAYDTHGPLVVFGGGWRRGCGTSGSARWRRRPSWHKWPGDTARGLLHACSGVPVQ